MQRSKKNVDRVPTRRKAKATIMGTKVADQETVRSNNAKPIVVFKYREGE